MKKFVLALVLTGLAAPALAQTGQEKRNQAAYNQLVDQYATATLGFFIENRCRQLDETAYGAFSADQKTLNDFMKYLMGVEAWMGIVENLRKTAEDTGVNPCNSDTFKFALATAQISSRMATRVKLLEEEDMAKLAAIGAARDHEVRQARQEAGQPTAPNTAGTTTPVQPQAQTKAQPSPEPELPASSAGEETFEFVPTTTIERQPENKKPANTQTATTEPQTQTQPQAQPVPSQSQSQEAAGILLANYVNPYPYTPAAPPPGETEKDMGRRHRQEIIDLRRAHRAELDAFKDNEDKYANPDAVKDFIKERQDDEFDAMRNRHQMEEDRY